MCAKSSKESRNQECTQQQWTMCGTRGKSVQHPAAVPLFRCRANVDAIILPAHSPAIVPELQGNTYNGPGSRQRLPCPCLSLSLFFACLACASLPFPCSVVAKCNHCNRFCTISNALGPQDAAPLALLCSLLRGCCLLDAAAAAVATVARCPLPVAGCHLV